MAKVFVNETNLRNIGDAIREKNESNQTYKPSEMAAAIDALPVYPEPTGTKAISSNGVHDVKDYANANVDVPNSYAAGDEGKVVSSGALVAQTSVTKNANGTYDTTTNNEVVVNVPNSYTAGDEGKVVSSGALVLQGSLTITENDTYDTTLISELIANISGGGGGTILFRDEKHQTSGSKLEIDSDDIEIMESGQYYFFCGLYCTQASVTINGVTQTNDYDYSTDYIHYVEDVVTLTAGDIIRLNAYGNSGHVGVCGILIQLQQANRGSFPFVDEGYQNGQISVTYMPTSMDNISKFNTSYARNKADFIGYGKNLDNNDIDTNLNTFLANTSGFKPTSLEYYGNVYNNSSMISDLGLVLLSDASQGASSVTLSDSIANYSAVILQGIYQKNRTSVYNTSMLYVPKLNTSYWTGMKDRNTTYDCNVTFTDNTHATLTGNKQCMIYGLP